MKNLPLALLLEKNKLATPNPWLETLDVTFPAPVSTTVYLVKNTEEIAFGGQTYTPFPFKLDVVKHSGQGDIPTVNLMVSNVTRVLQGYIEELNGAIGATVLYRVINAANLAADYADLEIIFSVLAAVADAQWISFTLGAPNPLSSNFPPDRYNAGSCNWDFKSVECGYSGTAEACNLTLDDCRALGNSRRFGGFPGLAGGGVRLA